MDKDPEVVQKNKRGSIIDRINIFSGDEGLTSIRKKRPVRDRLNEPRPKIDEGYDSWMDDTEEEYGGGIVDNGKKERS